MVGVVFMLCACLRQGPAISDKVSSVCVICALCEYTRLSWNKFSCCLFVNFDLRQKARFPSELGSRLMDCSSWYICGQRASSSGVVRGTMINWLRQFLTVWTGHNVILSNGVVGAKQWTKMCIVFCFQVRKAKICVYLSELFLLEIKSLFMNLLTCVELIWSCWPDFTWPITLRYWNLQMSVLESNCDIGSNCCLRAPGDTTFRCGEELFRTKQIIFLKREWKSTETDRSSNCCPREGICSVQVW